jgi:hypothetical protein
MLVALAAGRHERLDDGCTRRGHDIGRLFRRSLHEVNNLATWRPVTADHLKVEGD